MFNPPHLPLQSFFSLLLLLFILIRNPSYAAVGTASHYGPPYLPTVCYGGDSSQFPAYDLFVAAGEGIWDNDASCGRQYAVRCLSSPTPRACIIPGRVIQVKVVDRASTLNSVPSRNRTTMVLSAAAFRMITNGSVNMINIEFIPV